MGDKEKKKEKEHTIIECLEDSGIGEFEGFMEDKGFFLKETGFTPKQTKVLALICRKAQEALEWHDQEDDTAHIDLITPLEKAMKRHRHDFSKSYSGKPEQ